MRAEHVRVRNLIVKFQVKVVYVELLFSLEYLLDEAEQLIVPSFKEPQLVWVIVPFYYFTA